jgi:hypothetical protein
MNLFPQASMSFLAHIEESLRDQNHKIFFDCVQKDSRESWSTMAMSFIDFFLEEIQENAGPPTVIVIVMLIYQLTNHVRGLHRVERE